VFVDYFRRKILVRSLPFDRARDTLVKVRKHYEDEHRSRCPETDPHGDELFKKHRKQGNHISYVKVL